MVIYDWPQYRAVIYQATLIISIWIWYTPNSRIDDVTLG